MKKLLFVLSLLAPTFAFAGINTKTIEYSFKQSTGPINAWNVRAFEPITVFIPETTSRKFVSVFTYTHHQDSATATTTPTSVTHGLGIDAVAFSSITVVDNIANSGENFGLTFVSTWTNYFNSNFTGTSHTVSLNSIISISTTNNCSSKLVITYEYDDTEATQIKTVRIPIQGSTGTLNTTSLKIDSIPGASAQIPALDSWLPEQSKTYRDIFFEINVNDSVTAATGITPQMGVRLDAETETLDADHSIAMNSARRYTRLWKRTDMDTATTHDMYARTTNTNMGFNVMAVVLTVTYEYNVNTSTEVMNSIVLPITSKDMVAGGTTYRDRSTLIKRFEIPETNPVLANSGIVMFTHDQNAPSVFLQSGLQTVFSSYTYPAILACGDKTLSHRIDRDNGFTIRQGTNTYLLNFYRNGTTSGNLISHFSGGLYLNYKSSNTAQVGRDSNHNKTIFYAMHPYQADAIEMISISTAPVIRPANYFLTNVGYQKTMIKSTVGGPNNSFVKVTIASDTIDATGAGFFSDIQNFASEGELALQTITHDITDFFKTNEYGNNRKLNFESTRLWQIGSNGDLTYDQGVLFYTVHSVTFTVAGTVSGYTGDGSGINVDIFNYETNDLVAYTTTSAGGTFTTPVYANSYLVYAVAYQDSTHKGVSASGTPGSSTFNISFSGGSTPTQTGTIFIK